MNPEVLRVPVEDNVFHRLELLKRSQNDRRRYREFFVEGVKGIKQARAHGWPIRSLVYAAGRPLSPWGRDMLTSTPGATHIELGPALMDRLSDKHEPSELVAIVGMPPDSPGRVKPSAEALVAVVDRPSSPGNLGSIIRSSHALGADGVIVTGAGTDIYHPLTVRASMGSLFVLPTVRLESHVELASWLRDLTTARGRPGRDRGPKGRMRIVGASSDAGQPADTVDLTLPTVLVFGNEATGLSPEYRALCDTSVRIPMHAEADSINVACAAAILLYEVDRQRRAKRRMGPRPWSKPRRDQGLRIDREDGTPARRP
jgi:23S rRNA (uridine2479-2'-O)-methyltransferase